MDPTKRILVPTDLSEASTPGLGLGSALAQQSNAELLVLHVTSELQRWPVSEEFEYLECAMGRSRERFIEEASLGLTRFLQEHLEDIRRAPAIRTKTVLGQASQKIVEIAAEEKVDLIVMAPRLRGTLKRRLLGSVTDAVARSAPCPVLSVCYPQPGPWREGQVHDGSAQAVYTEAEI